MKFGANGLVLGSPPKPVMPGYYALRCHRARRFGPPRIRQLADRAGQLRGHLSRRSDLRALPLEDRSPRVDVLQWYGAWRSTHSSFAVDEELDAIEAPPRCWSGTAASLRPRDTGTADAPVPSIVIAVGAARAGRP
jgi:hypothetical protein